ncbi:MAG: tetratricopeptide repeat protein [Pirellulales bacterium]|nr:tetratricopeptide repeat protein [Pirellulales bacterium]
MTTDRRWSSLRKVGAGRATDDRCCALIAATLLLAGSLCVGCKAPVRDGPVSEPLATCRQYSQRGMLAIEQGNWAEAEWMLSQAIETCPVDAVAREHYAETLWHRGERAAALAQIEQAIKLRGDDPALEVRAAQMLLDLGQPERAEAHVRWALVLDSHSASAWLVLGQLRARAGQTDDALTYYHRALVMDPDDRATLRALAELQDKLNLPHKSLINWQMLAQTYEAGQQPADVQMALGGAYHANGRYDEAAESFLAARERGAPPLEVCRRLATIWQAAGRTDLASRANAEATALEQQAIAARALAARPATPSQAPAPSPAPTTLR